MTLDKLVKEYWKSPGFKALSPSSQRSYDHCTNYLTNYFRGREIESIKRSDMIKLANDLSDRPATSNLTVNVASVLFSFAMDIDALPYNPAARLKKLKIGSHTRWHVEDARKGVQVHDRAVRMAIILAWHTGQRESDILKMKWGDIREGYIHVTQAKTKIELKIKVNTNMIPALNEARGAEPEDYYILSGKKPLSPQAFRGRFRRHMDAIGVYKTFHGIRKGVACDLAENGRSTKEIAALLGHKTERMASFYAKQANDTKMAASAVDSITPF